MANTEQQPRLSSYEQSLADELAFDSKLVTEYVGYPGVQVDVAAEEMTFSGPDERALVMGAAMRAREATRPNIPLQRKYRVSKGPSNVDLHQQMHLGADERPRGVNTPGTVTPLLFHYVDIENKPGAEQAIIDSAIEENPRVHYVKVMTALGNNPEIAAAPSFGLKVDLRKLPRIFEVLQSLMSHLEPAEQRDLQYTWREAVKSASARVRVAQQKKRLHYNIDQFEELQYTKR